MVNCDICGATFKNTQGLAGHKRLRHAEQQQQMFSIASPQLYRRINQRLVDKVAERLADLVMESHEQQLLEGFLDQMACQGLNLNLSGREETRKAIIVAAGQPAHLLPLTDDKPGCLLNIGDKPILERELDALRGCGISEIVVVRGYRGDKIGYPGIQYYDNLDYESSGILKSLFSADMAIHGEFVFSYSDIIYKRNVLQRLLSANTDIALVVDRDWMKRYDGRGMHPVEEAELTLVEGDRITAIGKNIIDIKEAHGEFIGLAKFSPRGAEILKSSYEQAVIKYGKRRFHNAPSVEKACFGDMIQELINKGHVVHSVDIQGGWDEIDTIEDLERAGLHSWLN